MCVLQSVKYQHIVEYVTPHYYKLENLKLMAVRSNVCFCFPLVLLCFGTKKRKMRKSQKCIFFLSENYSLLSVRTEFSVWTYSYLLGKWYFLLGSSDINQIPQEALIWPKCQWSRRSVAFHSACSRASRSSCIFFWGTSQRTHIPLCTPLHDTSAAVSRRKKIVHSILQWRLVKAPYTPWL